MSTLRTAGALAGLLALAACGPSAGVLDDGEWVVGQWYRYKGCDDFPCPSSLGEDVAVADFEESGTVLTDVVSLCTNDRETEGAWSPVEGGVRLDPIEDGPFSWVGRTPGWVIVRAVDECTLESENSRGHTYLWKRGVVELVPNIFGCEGDLVAGNSEARACVSGSG